MTESDLFTVAGTPFCQALMLERWDAPAGRFFVAYRARHGFASLLGHVVVDEFRTISGPILLAPQAIVGGIYDVGMRLADARDVGAPIDKGWPPLTIGINVKPPARTDDWREQMLHALEMRTNSAPVGWDCATMAGAAGDYRIQTLSCSVAGKPVATLIVTDAPMLPAQLQRLVDTDHAPITLAVSTGNRLPRASGSELHHVQAVSESQLAEIVQAAGKLTIA